MTRVPNSQVNVVTEVDFNNNKLKELKEIQFIDMSNINLTGVLKLENGQLKFTFNNTISNITVNLVSGAGLPIASPSEFGTSAAEGKTFPLNQDGEVPAELVPAGYIKVFEVASTDDVVNPKNGYIAITPTDTYIYKVDTWKKLNSSNALQPYEHIQSVATDNILITHNRGLPVPTVNITNEDGTEPMYIYWKPEGVNAIRVQPGVSMKFRVYIS